jgi:hypothetical protein
MVGNRSTAFDEVLHFNSHVLLVKNRLRSESNSGEGKMHISRGTEA